MLAKLDAYDYAILPGIIRIRLNGTNDPDIVDIMSEVYNTDGLIYLEGYRYNYLDNYRIYRDVGGSFLELDVQRTT